MAEKRKFEMWELEFALNIAEQMYQQGKKRRKCLIREIRKLRRKCGEKRTKVRNGSGQD
jgi:hypothetical protein